MGCPCFWDILVAKYRITTLKAQHVVIHLLSSRHNHPASSITLWGPRANLAPQRLFENTFPVPTTFKKLMKLPIQPLSATDLEFLHSNPESSKWVGCICRGQPRWFGVLKMASPQHCQVMRVDCVWNVLCTFYLDIQYSICIYRKSWESLRLSAGRTPPWDNSFERFVVCPKQVQHRQSILINQLAGAPIPG